MLAQEGAVDTEARIERILELKRQLGEIDRELERLLASLTPELRAEIERRWGLEPPPVAAEEVPATELLAVSDRATPQVASKIEPPAPAGPRCGTLEILDTNGDGRVSGADRYWRYLNLWRDDGDGSIEASEVRSLYQHGIRRVSVKLLSYTTSKDVDRGVWIEDAIYFDLPTRGKGRAVLVMDAGRLARGDELWLESGAGERLDGIQALRSGLEWVMRNGARVAVLCGSTAGG